MNNFKVLVSNFADKNIPYINLSFSDKCQQKVERSVKILQLEFQVDHADLLLPSDNLDEEGKNSIENSTVNCCKQPV